MTSTFDRLVARMDQVTAARMTRTVIIDGDPYQVSEDVQPLEMAALNGEGIVLLVFSENYRPRRQQAVTWKGRDYVVTSHRLFNGKPQIRIE